MPKPPQIATRLRRHRAHLVRGFAEAVQARHEAVQAWDLIDQMIRAGCYNASDFASANGQAAREETKAVRAQTKAIRAEAKAVAAEASVLQAKAREDKNWTLEMLFEESELLALEAEAADERRQAYAELDKEAEDIIKEVDDCDLEIYPEMEMEIYPEMEMVY